MRAQRAHVVGDEILRALDDPAEIANAELLRLDQSAGQGQPSRVGEGSRAAGRKLGFLHIETLTPDSFRGLEIETKQIAMIVSHYDILTCVAAFSFRGLSAVERDPTAVLDSGPESGALMNPAIFERFLIADSEEITRTFAQPFDLLIAASGRVPRGSQKRHEARSPDLMVGASSLWWFGRTATLTPAQNGGFVRGTFPHLAIGREKTPLCRGVVVFLTTDGTKRSTLEPSSTR